MQGVPLKEARLHSLFVEPTLQNPWTSSNLRTYPQSIFAHLKNHGRHIDALQTVHFRLSVWLTHVTRKPPFELQRSIVNCPNKPCLNLQERFTTPSPFSTLVSDVLDVVVPVVKIGLVIFCKASSKCNFLWIVSGRSLRANTINPSSRMFSVFGDSPSQSSSVVACDSKEGHSLPNFTRRWTRVSQNLICKSIGARNFFLTSEYRAARYNVKDSLECSFEGGAFIHR